MEIEAKKTITCDACKCAVDIRKPKKDEPPCEGIIATLNTNLLLGETKDYHFCNEDCLRTFLNERHTARGQAKASLPHVVELDMTKF